MIPDDLKIKILPYLGDRIEEGSPVLFTGAGFSLDAKNMIGENLPGAGQLRSMLWSLCFPGEPLNADSTLQDLYAAALAKQKTRMTALLKQSLCVDPQSLPDYYRPIFEAPWSRVYTLNIDDLDSAVQTRFAPTRWLHPISATSQNDERKFGSTTGDFLDVVHLHGTLGDLPDYVTFSRAQYGGRAGQQDPWYATLVSELLSHCVVFIGSQLDEALLWQHIQMRRERGERRLNELRPRSYLVIPHLDPARRELLQQFNIVWIPATAREFADEILTPLKARCLAGLAKFHINATRSPHIPLVSELDINPDTQSEFLMGSEPIWADLQSGRAIEREHDSELSNIVDGALAELMPGIVVLTGTAGSGKSTAIMRASLRLSSAGRKVGWIDKDSDITSAELRRALRERGKFEVVAIDDADLFGKEISVICGELGNVEHPPLLLLGMRSSRVDRVIDRNHFEAIAYQESAVPNLTDDDIGKLVSTLDAHNRLGALKGLTRADQYARFRDFAGRQLLVAMLSATSATPFKEKPIKEFDDLSGESKLIYGTICVASAFRYALDKTEIVLATGGNSNAALNELEALIRRHIVTVHADGTVRARHRVIAELLLDELIKDGDLRPVLQGLALVGATQVSRTGPNTSKAWRLLKQVLNHDFLARSMETQEATMFYGGLEDLLAWNYHYWLQRGSLEVEAGSIDLAEQFLSQAVSLEPDDLFVRTEWAYLLFRKAIQNPLASSAADLVREATQGLEEMISSHKFNRQYAAHILGSQGLAWARRGIPHASERSTYLKKLIATVRGIKGPGPLDQDMENLLDSLVREELATVVNP